jgi:hypothetical protein
MAWRLLRARTRPRWIDRRLMPRPRIRRRGPGRTLRSAGFYAIGVAEPTSIMVETFGNSVPSDTRLTQLVRRISDLTFWAPRDVDLARPIYQKTAAYGHWSQGGGVHLGAHRQGEHPRGRMQQRAPPERAFWLRRIDQ